ncbi:hypothetical protein BO70DRAFT_341695 [Aspergillus heteromorphus CBS 117.55]|uniref:Core domain-containing protein n=1 Tax=Aspergillus heteromorphus CBS 117.55 TaxID=1448321 RepID=A0A317VP96_9EURO|nr:uncharacterized protein BO70DRAFT_341695 [Aspergillus heteromorphus CBS 117.55]PWY73680.1 hypothetical protein BO70DRAFT_341695 [Aspergillus heteromorphus CBS 117.55]
MRSLLTNGSTTLGLIYNQSNNSSNASRYPEQSQLQPRAITSQRPSPTPNMSRPVLSTAARRLSRPHVPRAAVSAFSSPAPTLNFSASFCDSISQRAALRPFPRSRNTLPQRTASSQQSALRFDAFQQRAAFSSSTVRPGAKVTQNPRVDDDGNELLINISDIAAERLREITDPTSSPSVTKEENPYHHLRITVTSGGCHGFQYMMSLEAASKIDPEEDTVFEAERAEGDASAGEAKVVMDEPSLELLSGSTVDYTMELIGSQFKIVDNPRATSNCGCGTSFDVQD